MMHSLVCALVVGTCSEPSVAARNGSSVPNAMTAATTVTTTTTTPAVAVVVRMATTVWTEITHASPPAPTIGTSLPACSNLHCLSTRESWQECQRDDWMKMPWCECTHAE